MLSHISQLLISAVYLLPGTPCHVTISGDRRRKMKEREARGEAQKPLEMAAILRLFPSRACRGKKYSTKNLTSNESSSATSYFVYTLQ